MSDKTLDQRRAGHALGCVERLAGQNIAGRYRRYAEGLPAHVVMGGLGQAVATELAAARLGEGADRNDNHRAHERLVNDLESWLGATVYRPKSEKDARNTGWLPRAIVDNDQALYLRAQAEALAWLVWLKKFCQANLPRAAEE